MSRKGNGHICSNTKSYETRSLGKLRDSRSSSGPAPHHSPWLFFPSPRAPASSVARPATTPAPRTRSPAPIRQLLHGAAVETSCSSVSSLGASQAVQQSTEANLFIPAHLCTHHVPRPPARQCRSSTSSMTIRQCTPRHPSRSHLRPTAGPS